MKPSSYFSWIGILLFSAMSLFAGPKDSLSVGEGEPAGNLSELALLDSLGEMLGRTADVPEKIDLLNDFAMGTLDANHHFSKECAERALALCKNASHPTGEFKSHYVLGQVYANYEQNYHLAMFHLNKALEGVRKTEGDVLTELSILKLMGYIHHRQDNVEESSGFYKEAIELALENHLSSHVADLNAYLADLMEMEGKEEEALYHYKQVLDLETQNGFKETTAGSMTAIARYYFLIEDYDKSSAYYDKAAEKFKQEGNHRWAAYVMALVGDLRLSTGKIEAALQSATDGLELAEKYNLPKEIADNHAVLSDIYAEAGDHKRALYHFKALTAVEDSMFSIRKTREIASITAQHEQELKRQGLEQAVRENESKEYRSRIISYMAIGTLLVFAVLSVFLYRNYRQKLRVNAQLEDRVELKDLALSEIVVQLRREIAQHQETQSKLENSNHELNHFIYKSSHDLKGPLASIMGLADIASGELEESERIQYIDLIKASSERLGKRIDALIHVTVLSEKALELKPLDLAGQIEQAISVFEENGLSKGTQLYKDLEPGLAFRTDEYFLRTILSQLLENALKYRNAKGEQAWVRIEAKRLENGLRLSISDNGKGISPELQSQAFGMFVKSKNDFQNSGLGLYLVKRAVERMNGSIKLQSQVNQGTTVTVILPSIKST